MREEGARGFVAHHELSDPDLPGSEINAGACRRKPAKSFCLLHHDQAKAATQRCETPFFKLALQKPHTKTGLLRNTQPCKT
jgi:hypothetical protein